MEGNRGQIFELIGKAMSEIGAIGKDSVSTNSSGKVMYKFRGIDAVYNALNPVMAKYGLFVCPEILNQQRDERRTANGTVMTYTILTIRFTMYAPDGSSIQMTVIGEGMDAGDKSTNKAMSIAMKYAMFQLFMIPTEEMKDPDAEVPDPILPKGENQKPATMTKSATVPPAEKKAPQAEKKAPDLNTAEGFVKNEMAFMAQRLEIGTEKEMIARFGIMKKELTAAGVVEDKKIKDMTLDEAKTLIAAMYDRYFTDKAESA